QVKCFCCPVAICSREARYVFLDGRVAFCHYVTARIGVFKRSPCIAIVSRYLNHAEIPLLFNIVVMLERQSRVGSRHCCSKDQFLICFVPVICMQYLCTRPFWICYSLPLQWQEINAVKLQAADIFAEVELFKVTAPCRNAFFFKCFRFFKV